MFNVGSVFATIKKHILFSTVAMEITIKSYFSLLAEPEIKYNMKHIHTDITL